MKTKFGYSVIAIVVVLFSVGCLVFVNNQSISNEPLSRSTAVNPNNLSTELSAKMTAQTTVTAQGPQLPSLSAQWATLTASAEKQGYVVVDVSLKSPAWHSLVTQTIKLNDSQAMKQRDMDLMTLSEHVRSQLLQALTSYNYTVLGGIDASSPVIILKVDKTALYYLKTLPVVESIADGSLVGNNMPGD